MSQPTAIRLLCVVIDSPVGGKVFEEANCEVEGTIEFNPKLPIRDIQVRVNGRTDRALAVERPEGGSDSHAMFRWFVEKT